MKRRATPSSILNTSKGQSHNTLHIDFLNPNLPLDVKRSPTPKPVHPHDHANFIEIVLVISGTALHHWGRTHQTLSMGDLFCIAPSEPHSYTDVTNFEIINCLFEPALINPHHELISACPGLVEFLLIEPLYRQETRKRRLIQLPPSALEQAIDQLTGIATQLNIDSQHTLTALGLLYQFLGLIETHHDPAELPDFVAGQNWAFAQARSYMIENLAEDLDLKSLADSAYLSPAHFSRIFKETTGLSPIAYLTRLRLDRAVDLLTTTTQSITEIGFNCGFQDPAYFARVFKKNNGVSPRQYRQTAKSSKNSAE